MKLFDSGGAIQAIRTKEETRIFELNISNCLFQNCSANNYGGALAVEEANVSIKSCIFKNCSSPNGGAIYYMSPNSYLMIFDQSLVSGIPPKQNPIRYYGLVLHTLRLVINNDNITRVCRMKSDGASMKIYGSAIDMKYIILSKLQGASIIMLEASQATMEFVSVKRCISTTNGIFYLIGETSILKGNNIIFRRCVSILFNANSSTMITLKDCVVTMTNTSELFHPSLQQISGITFKKDATYFSNIGNPNIDNILAALSIKSMKTNTFTASASFVPTHPFTASCTLSGLVFHRNNKTWPDFKKTLKIIAVAATAPILKDVVNVF